MNCAILSVERNGFMSKFMDLIEREKWDEIKQTDITSLDLQDVAAYYQDILNLETAYETATMGRKQLGQTIKKKLLSVQSFLHLLEIRNDQLVNHLSYAEQYINDYEMAIRVLLRMANDPSENFVLKQFQTLDFASTHYEGQISTEECVCQHNTVWLIGKREVLDTVDNKKVSLGSDFGKVADDLLTKGTSLIVFTNHRLVSNVTPKHYDPKKIDHRDLMVKTTNGIDRFSCYLCEDSLKDAVIQFTDFIEENGSDIKGIAEDALFNAIQTNHMKQNKQKVFLPTGKDKRVCK